MKKQSKPNKKEEKIKEKVKKKEEKEEEKKEKEIKIPENYVANLNKIKRYDPKLALWIHEKIKSLFGIYSQLQEAIKSEARAWEEVKSLEIEIDRLTTIIEQKEVMIIRMNEELKEKEKRVKDLEMRERELIAKTAIAEQLYTTLLSQIIFLKQKIAELASEDIKEMFEKEINRITRILEKLEETTKSMREISIPAGGGGEKS